MVPSLGSHIMISRDRIPMKHGMAIRVPGKVAFIVPWPEFWVIGTTDAPYEGPPDRPTASGAEVDRLLEIVNTVLDVGLTRDDITGTYAGLRPLVGEAQDGGTVKVSREHKVSVDRNGLVRIGGGKYTTYRLMARDAVDMAIGTAEAAKRPSATADLPLVGAAPRSVLNALADRLSRDAGLTNDQGMRLAYRHGTEAMAVVEIGRQRDLLRPLIPDRPFLEAEVVWAAHRELALTIDDVLARRFRLAMELRARGASVAPRVAELLGGELGWDARRQEVEVEAYLRGARREYGVPGRDMPDPGAETPPDRGPATVATDATIQED